MGGGGWVAIGWRKKEAAASGTPSTVALTAREAAALLTGLQMARAIPGVGDTELFAGLLAKLARGASSTILRPSTRRLLRRLRMRDLCTSDCRAIPQWSSS